MTMLLELKFGKLDAARPAYWFLFHEGQLLVRRPTENLGVPFASAAELGLNLAHTHFIGTLDGLPCHMGEARGETQDKGLEGVGLRQFFAAADDGLFAAAGRAQHVLGWDKAHQYCGRCGSPANDKSDELAKICPECGQVSYPVIAPAIIVAITRGHEILLARGTRFTAPTYSVLAGFVEPGENLEQCVRREVREEVGIELDNIKYFGSQPWPFPNSLMLGFTAEFAGGDLKLQPEEIVDAGWFRADNLPPIPGSISISRQLIDWFRTREGTPA
jgi:NAD+ diphosphatase